MYAFFVNKNADYSVPILFCSLPMLNCPPPLKLQETVKTVNNTTIKQQVAKPVKKVVQKKETTLAVPKMETKKEQSLDPFLSFDKLRMNGAKTLGTNEKEKENTVEIEKKIVPAAPKPVTEKKTVPAKELPQHAQVSNNFREVEELRRGAQLQKELVQKWQPPIGVSPDCTCDISFFVNKQGIIEQLKMVKSSGIMMFDISARQALFSMKMPQWTYGKPLIISFKQ